MIQDIPGRSHPQDVADVGGQHDGHLPPLPRHQRVGQPAALLLLRQALLGYHAEDVEAVVRLALHDEDGDGKDGQRHGGGQTGWGGWTDDDDGAIKHDAT